MPFTAQELANIANAAIDFHMKGKAFDQSISEKPLLKALKAGQETFPGGKEFITWPVKGVHTSAIQGYSHDDTVSYSNPANIKRAQASWYEIHEGISFTGTELKKDGISVVDSTTGDSTSEHSERELTALTNILEDKLQDMTEGWAETFNLMLWKDGTQDAKQVPGVQSFIRTAPTTGTLFGIDTAANSWFRNRTNLSVASNSGTWANQPLVRALQQDFRQLRRYQGMKPTLMLAGSDFLDALEMELRSKGNYTLEGWAKSGTIDASVADVAFKGLKFEYDPTLDDLSKAKYCYALDMKNIKLKVMDGEDMKQHSPARPEDKYVYFRAITWTGGLIAKGLRGCEVFSIA
jgi:hypothetical protein